MLTLSAGLRRNLDLKMSVEQSRPDFILADYQVKAAEDVIFESQTPLATMWP